MQSLLTRNSYLCEPPHFLPNEPMALDDPWVSQPKTVYTGPKFTNSWVGTHGIISCDRRRRLLLSSNRLAVTVGPMSVVTFLIMRPETGGPIKLYT